MTDLNRAIGQIAAYTTYLEGCNRGKGPTIFELSFHNADTIGSPCAFLNAVNNTFSQTMKYGFHKTGALHSDLKTTSSKWKAPTSGHVSCQDSHRHDTILVTSARNHGFPRRNLTNSDFSLICVPWPSIGGCPTESIVLPDNEGMDPSEIVGAFGSISQSKTIPLVSRNFFPSL